MLYSEKHTHEEEAQGQVCVEAHHEEVLGRQLRGQGNFEWNTDLIETKKFENYARQVAQDLYSGEELTKNNTADLYTKDLDGLRTQSLARKLGLRILGAFEQRFQSSRGVSILSSNR